MTEQREASMGEVIQAAQRFAQRAGRPVVDGALAPATSAPAPTSTTPVVEAPATPATPAVPGRVAPRPARPLTPAEAGGRLRYVGSVAAAGARRAPVVVWDAVWDRAKLAVYREGQTHRGPVDDRHRQAYMDAVARRKAAMGRVLRGALAPWTAWKARVGRVPVPAVTWGVTAGCAAAARWPEQPLLRAFAQLNGLLAEAAGVAGAVLGTAGLYGGGAVLLAGLAYGAGKAMCAEHAERQALARQRVQVQDGATVGVREDGELLPAIPLDEATSPVGVMEAVRRALAIEKVQARPLEATPTPWGWQVVVQLKKGTPADVAARTAQLETLLDVRENGVLVQPHRDRRARVTLRLVESDPWATLPAVPDYAATRRTSADPIWMGQRLDGVQISMRPRGRHMLILAASGGGKSILLRLLVDGLGAAEDVHIWDLDPSGVGQAPQEAVMGKVALTPEDCEEALTQALAIAGARTRMLRALGMGDSWQPSPQRPLLVLVVDEFPRLTKAGKAAAVALLRVARKAGVVLWFASQDPKKDTLGDSIAGQVACRAGGPGLIDWQADQLFGPGAKSRGWDPGRYQPATADGQVNDAGTFYITGHGGGVVELALPTRVGYLDQGTARPRAEAYRAAGRCPELDLESLQRAGLTPEEVYTHTDAGQAQAAQQAAAIPLPSEEDEQPAQLSEEVRQFLAAAVAVYGEDDAEWVPTQAMVREVGVGELGWPAPPADDATEARRLQKLHEMRVATILKKAGVASTRKTIKGEKTTVVARLALLAAAGALPTDEGTPTPHTA